MKKYFSTPQIPLWYSLSASISRAWENINWTLSHPIMVSYAWSLHRTVVIPARALTPVTPVLVHPLPTMKWLELLQYTLTMMLHCCRPHLLTASWKHSVRNIPLPHALRLHVNSKFPTIFGTLLPRPPLFPPPHQCHILCLLIQLDQMYQHPTTPTSLLLHTLTSGLLQCKWQWSEKIAIALTISTMIGFYYKMGQRRARMLGTKVTVVHACRHIAGTAYVCVRDLG